MLERLAGTSYALSDLVGDSDWSNSENSLVLRFPGSDLRGILWAVTRFQDADDVQFLLVGRAVLLRFRWTDG